MSEKPPKSPHEIWAPKIGDKVWLFDVNRRQYTVPTDAEKKNGKLYGDLVWRSHWRESKIVGENRVSWILEHGEKIQKRPAFLHNESPCFSEAELSDRCFVYEHCYRISDEVRRVDAAKLRQIAEIVGYKVKDSP